MNDKLSWQTVEYLHREKSADWYWIVSIVTISIAVIAIILNNIIFAILIIVSIFTLTLFASKKPEVIDVLVDERGVTLGKTHYPYKDLDSFWVAAEEVWPKIILKSKKVFSPLIVVFIEEIEPKLVREELVKYLPEEEHVEPFLEKLLLYFGF